MRICYTNVHFTYLHVIQLTYSTMLQACCTHTFNLHKQYKFEKLLYIIISSILLIKS